MIPLKSLAKGLSSQELAELLRQREQAEANGDQTLRDIYGYVDNSGNGAYAITPNGLTGGEQGWGSTGGGLTVADTQANNGADGNAPQAPVNFDPGALFREGISLLSNNNNNEGSGGYTYRVNDSKFPQTRFGGVSATAPVNDDNRDLLIDPRYVYDDPNYGEITFGPNVNTQDWSDMIFPAIMAAMSGGMGLLGAPALAMQLPGLLQGISNGGSPWGALLSMIGGQMGLPGWATSLGRTALGFLDGGKKP